MVLAFPQNINEYEVRNIFLTVFLQCGATCDIQQKKKFRHFLRKRFNGICYCKGL